MFSKPLGMILVYIVTTFNMLVLLLPFLAVIIPFISIESGIIIIENTIFHRIEFMFFFTMFLVSFLMLVYLFFDYLFGFAVNSSIKNCVRYEKIKDYDFLTDLFDQVKNKFGQRNVKLYIKNSNEINAYAVSSLGKKCVVLTRGIINHYSNCFDNPKDFLYALRSIIGHEMSHLANKDFLPTLLIIVNQKVTNLVAQFFRFVLSVIIRISVFMPFVARFSARLTHDGFFLINSIVTFFNRIAVFGIYEILRKFISRSIEYRCDMQSAKAFGGKNMALALSKLGSSGYFTLFSTHPTTKSRIRKVEKITIKDSIVKPRFFDSLANYFSMLFLITICLYFAKEAQIDLYARYYIREHEFLHQKLLTIWNLISRFF